jgi:hypothetical protein
MNVLFQPIDNCSNHLTGSKITLKPYHPPYITSSYFSFGGPVGGITDLITGSLILNNVTPGYYKMSVGPSNAMSNINNFDNMVKYILVPSGSGIVNVNTLFISSSALLPQ